MLNYEFPPIGGGAANANLCLLKEYAKNYDLTVDLLTSAKRPGFFEEELAKNITIYKVGLHKKSLHYWRRTEVIEWLIKSRRHYRELLRDNDYDLVHAFFGFPTAYLCYRTVRRLPYIISLRGSDVPGYNSRLGMDYKLTAGLFRRIWSAASAVIANSKGLQQLAQDFMPDLDIKVIPNGIDTQKFHPAQQKERKGPIRLITVGRLITRKRTGLLIEAIDCARKMGLDARLSIAGHGNLLRQLQALAKRLNLTDRVSFLERVPADEMPELYRRNDIFLMCSTHEGMSNAMLEAMASGLPIVTTRCEGVEELISDNGIVVERAEPEDFAGAIRSLGEDEVRFEEFSRVAVEKARLFSWKAVAEKYLACYERVLEEGGKN